MFFKLHNEGKIGFKQLTDADLRRTTGNTTHIGLFNDILTFLPDDNYEDEAMFLYNKSSESLLFSFDRINRKTGRIDAPKVKTGGKNVISVVTAIKDIANNPIDNKRWFLIWFGLANEKVVTFLFNNSSEEFNDLSRLIDLSKDMVKGRINSGEPNFAALLEYLEKYVNQNNIQYLSELEIISQTNDFHNSERHYKPFDILRANEIFDQIGKKGEEIIANYLEYQKSKNLIFNYTWYNKSMETGLPYDFSVQRKDQNVIFVDVKSTNFKFEQSLIFSSQEIKFITEKSNYHIYRVYDLLEETADYPKLRICKDTKNLANSAYPHILQLSNSLNQQHISLQTAKITVQPTNEILSFEKEISLPFK